MVGIHEWMFGNVQYKQAMPCKNIASMSLEPNKNGLFLLNFVYEAILRRNLKKDVRMRRFICFFVASRVSCTITHF